MLIFFGPWKEIVCIILMYKPSSMPFIKLLFMLAVAGLVPPAKDHHAQSVNTKSTAAAQEMFNYIRCHRQAKNIVVNWGMTSQLGVTRYIVYFSEDNEFFDPIAEITADDASLKYSFKHLDVFPGYHYYYIAAIRSGLPTVNSATDVVRIVGH
jgi:hypothetical protein